MKTMIAALAVCGLIVFSAAAMAAPGKGEHQSIEVLNLDCRAQVTVRWSLSSLAGEPVVNGTWKYDPWLSPDNCKTKHIPSIWLELQQGVHSGWVKIDPAMPNKPNEWGFSAPSSPNWEEAICDLLLSTHPSLLIFPSHKCVKFMPISQAKEMWKEGKVVSYRMSFSPDDPDDELPFPTIVPISVEGRAEFAVGQNIYKDYPEVWGRACDRAKEKAKDLGSIVPYQGEAYRGKKGSLRTKGGFDGCYCHLMFSTVVCDIDYLPRSRLASESRSEPAEPLPRTNERSLDELRVIEELRSDVQPVIDLYKAVGEHAKAENIEGVYKREGATADYLQKFAVMQFKDAIDLAVSLSKQDDLTIELREAIIAFTLEGMAWAERTRAP